MSTQPISLERFKEVNNAVFQALMTSDGMTAYELEKMTGYPRSSIRFVLNDNPLFYVDRWKITRHQHETQVWCTNVTQQLEDCPRPDYELRTE